MHERFRESDRKTTFRRHKRDRPRVIVLLTRIGDEEVLVGSRAAPSMKRAEPLDPEGLLE